jgi:hypothetical protein
MTALDEALDLLEKSEIDDRPTAENVVTLAREELGQFRYLRAAAQAWMDATKSGENLDIAYMMMVEALRLRNNEG